VIWCSVATGASSDWSQNTLSCMSVCWIPACVCMSIVGHLNWVWVWCPEIYLRFGIQRLVSSLNSLLLLFRAGGNSYGPEVAEWFAEALGIPCTLLRRESKSWKLQWRTFGVGERDDDDDGGSNEASEVSFVNEGQLLLVSKASIDELNQHMAVYVHDCLGEKNSKFSFWSTKKNVENQTFGLFKPVLLATHSVLF
jgi:hypothetical protein